MVSTTSETPVVVYGVTIGASAFGLLRGQLAYLREQGWDVHLATTPDDRAQATVTREGATLEPLPMERDIAPIADLRALFSWIRLLRRLRPQATHVGTPKAGLLGGIAALITRVPRRVYTLHGLRLEGATGLRAKILWLVEWIALHCATDVLMVSPTLAEEVHLRGLLRPGQALLVGEGSCNGVPGTEIAQRVAAMNRADLRASHMFSDTDIVVGFVGRVASDKGLDVLLNAISGLPESPPVRLLLVGGIEDAAIVPQIEAVGDRCVAVGWQEDVVPFYAMMDMLCLPTRREGLPTVVLEAAAAGLPTVTTRATGARDAVVDGATGILVDVGDAPAMAAAMTKLATSPRLRDVMGEAARDRVLREFVPVRLQHGTNSILRGQPSADIRHI